MISSFEVGLDKDIFEDLKDAKKQRGQKFTRRFALRVTQWTQFTLAELQKEPGKPQYPIRWKSDKQRIYVIIKLRKAGNLPYTRTHAYVRAWGIRQDLTPSGGSVSIQNSSGIERFVQGMDQQPFHIDTGWRNSSLVIRDAQEELMDIVTEVWYEAVS
jgi:hypothetical protein